MNFMPSRILTPLTRQSVNAWFWKFLNVIFLNLWFKWIWVNILYILIVFTYSRFLMSLWIVCILYFLILWDPFWKPYFIWKSHLNKDYYYIVNDTMAVTMKLRRPWTPEIFMECHCVTRRKPIEAWETCKQEG